MLARESYNSSYQINCVWYCTLMWMYSAFELFLFGYQGHTKRIIFYIKKTVSMFTVFNCEIVILREVNLHILNIYHAIKPFRLEFVNKIIWKADWSCYPTLHHKKALNWSKSCFSFIVFIKFEHRCNACTQRKLFL